MMEERKEEFGCLNESEKCADYKYGKDWTECTEKKASLKQLFSLYIFFSSYQILSPSLIHPW